MHLTIERSAFIKALAHVQSVVERRTTIPILANLMLKAEDGTLSLSATDLDIEIIEQVPAEIGTTGAATAPAHMLYDIVRKLPDGAQIDLNYSGDPGQLKISAGRSQFQLGCLPVEDFPSLSSGGLPHRFVLDATALASLVDRTRFAMSTEETRYYLNGIYLHAKDSEGSEVRVMRAVATDGHRLAMVEMPLPEGAQDMPGIILPRKTVGEIRKLVEESEGDIAIEVGDTKARFAFDNVVLTSKLIDGTFPDYERVIPDGADKHLSVDAKSFAEAVDRVSTISTERSRAVKLSIADQTMTISATSAEQGSASEEMEVGFDGEAMDIGFNARYLMDVTQNLTGEGTQLSMSDASSPTLIRDGDDESAVYVLMPMRV